VPPPQPPTEINYYILQIAQSYELGLINQEQANYYLSQINQ
jgi:hypothetical protein